eukprot:scaffold7066_cov253-Pinguiococcus_pyrenoidosus.AAC.36
MTLRKPLRPQLGQCTCAMSAPPSFTRLEFARALISVLSTSPGLSLRALSRRDFIYSELHAAMPPSTPGRDIHASA